MDALRVESISKNFGGVHALDNVSFSVEVGGKLAIIGPNGAGKTTLLNVLGGVLPPTSGHIYFFGQESTGLSPTRLAHLGQAQSFQVSTLFPSLNVLDNLLLAFHGIRASRFNMLRPFYSYQDYIVDAEKLLEATNLWEKRKEEVNALSHGEQKILDVALTLASNPKLLLLDEPSAGLSAEESADIIDVINNMSANITVLIVAHDMDLVFSLADKIMVLHYGQIIAHGTPDEVQNDSKVKDIYMGIENGKGSS